MCPLKHGTASLRTSKQSAMLLTLQKPTLRNHFGEILEGLSASTGRGMYEGKYTRTWETLLVSDSKGWK